MKKQYVYLAVLTLSILGYSMSSYGQCTDPDKYAYNCDFDGDGVLNLADLDDDNDGILDDEEQGDLNVPLSLERHSGKTKSGYSTAFLKNEYVNWGFTDITCDPVIWTAGQVFGQPWDNLPGHDEVRDIDKIYMDAFKLGQAPVAPTITVRFSRTVTNPILLFNHIKRDGNYDFALTDPDDMYLVDNSIGAYISNDTLYFPANNTSNGAVRGFSVCLVGSFDSIQFKGYATQHESQGFSLMVPGDIDSDADGIPNRFDRDSDDDDCYDAIEGGGSFTESDLDVNGALTGSVDANGVPTVAGSSGQSMSNMIDSTVSTCVELTDAGTDDMSNGIDSSDGWASTWADIDGDGDEDLFMCDKTRNKPNRVYRNNGNGTFTKDLGTGLSDYRSKTASALFGDYDNDGDEDCYVLNDMEAISRLWRNDGTGNFTQVLGVGLAEIPQYYLCGAWVDLDNDKFLDLILASFFETEYHQVYRNNGDGTFTRDRDCRIAKTKSRASSISVTDINNDGLPDIFFPNGDSSKNFLFINNGEFDFELLEDGDLFNDRNTSVACSWGDYDNDGFQDCYVVNANKQKNCLYKNNGNKTFSKVSSSVTTDFQRDDHCSNWFDCDNDGDLDLLISNDQGKNELYKNDGTGSFTRSTERSLLTYDCGPTISASICDYDKDGKQDVYFNNRNKKSNRLYKNNRSNSNKYLTVKLKGRNCNKDGYGSNIRVKAGGKWQTRYCTPGSGIGSGNSKRNSFGCGNNATVDSIVVTWPSGKKQCLTNQNTDRFLTIEEDPANACTIRTFFDANGNGVFDTGEKLKNKKKVQITENNSSHKTDTTGEFTVYLDDGTYNFTADDMKHWELGTATSANITTDTIIYIPLEKTSTGYDLDVTTGSTICRRGFTKETTLTVNNNGSNEAFNCEVKVIYPAEKDFVSADIAPTTISGDTVIWDIGTMDGGDEFTVRIIDSVNLVGSIGDTLVLESEVSANGTDLELDDNSYSEPEEIVGAVDPNDILVWPRGDGSDGYIEADQELTYRIRFQNVGTYMATYVHLRDKLPKNLDWSTFKAVESSHETHTIQVSEEGELYVYYKDINLIDSTTNEALSHGYFEFRIMPKEGIEAGEKIKNKAEISFDYEDPIITNTVVNTIKLEKEKTERYQLHIYPNPAQDEVIIAMSDYALSFTNVTELANLHIIASNGETVLKLDNVKKNRVDLAIRDLPSGIYYVKAIDTIGNIHTGRFMK